MFEFEIPKMKSNEIEIRINKIKNMAVQDGFLYFLTLFHMFYGFTYLTVNKSPTLGWTTEQILNDMVIKNNVLILPKPAKRTKNNSKGEEKMPYKELITFKAGRYHLSISNRELVYIDKENRQDDKSYIIDNWDEFKILINDRENDYIFLTKTICDTPVFVNWPVSNSMLSLYDVLSPNFYYTFQYEETQESDDATQSEFETGVKKTMNTLTRLKEALKLPESSKAFDPVSHPSHYAEGRIYEPRKVISDWGLNFNPP